MNPLMAKIDQRKLNCEEELAHRGGSGGGGARLERRCFLKYTLFCFYFNGLENILIKSTS